VVIDGAVVADLAPTGVLRAAINLGNPVLAHGSPDRPAGVTVDLANELAGHLGVPVSFVCFDAARKSFEALITGIADVGFLAVEPAREAEDMKANGFLEVALKRSGQDATVAPPS
jgi:polar amino acid transport system substrate-binding protein